jgi:hypothetical protein
MWWAADGTGIEFPAEEDPMGMPITVDSTRVVGEVAVFDTDRSITGQDGIGFGDAAEADAMGTTPAQLAARLFAADAALAHVFVASSQVVLRRHGGWDEAALSAAAAIIAGFFVHYA